MRHTLFILTLKFQKESFTNHHSSKLLTLILLLPYLTQKDIKEKQLIIPQYFVLVSHLKLK